VVSSTKDEIESDITITGDDGQTLAVFTGFTLRSLNASSRMTPERVDKGLYEIQWVDRSEIDPVPPSTASSPDNAPWLVFVDAGGVGTMLAEQLRRRGHRVRTVVSQPVTALTETDDEYALDPRQPAQLHQLLDAHAAREGDLAGIIDCWPLDTRLHPDMVEIDYRTGIFTILHLVKALAGLSTQTSLFLITANAQPALGTEQLDVDQAAIWGLGRVIGHQEFVDRWGGLIDIDDADDPAATASRICEHILADDPEDQIAIRGGSTFVPRLRLSASLTQAFPTKLTPNATYVVTGGAGALGRVVATYLAERGARHIALLCRSEVPPRDQWAQLAPDHRHRATVDMIRKVEDLGAHVSTASVDITDVDQVQAWVSGHVRAGGRPVRGIVHAAGTVNDRLLVNMTETDFTTVLAPKVLGARVLHEAFHGHDLEFFVMFGSAGSVIASPGQGNYAAANAFLDAFAHYRQALGLPALTIGWGPWSVGMVEELNLEKIYAQRGIELITPASGTRILDRLINQNTANVIAISADWMRARRAGLGGQLPPMFSELGTAESSPEAGDSGSSVLDVLSACPEADRLAMVADHVRQITAAVFELAVTDIGPDDALDDIGLDSMMAMDFRLRLNTMFAIDLPLLELLRGVSVNSLAARILADLQLAGGEPAAVLEQGSEPAADDDEVDRLVGQLSDDELRELLAELDRQAGEMHP
jgi:acyl carrier protein/NADP-dependent 3-hydroxy acid dehydrogenase YdfG